MTQPAMLATPSSARSVIGKATRPIMPTMRSRNERTGTRAMTPTPMATKKMKPTRT